ncbi:arabinose-5-phosphate isomerase [Limimonas halophila]|uniref:Arabinose-5-phosphate isomerase n=1 Tax=Limimonas halophila TaxID=1082479 RepID=A0A1G7TCF2_9PROT|nr:KpsF/GutQ family sugar-phosphate isomerase [Limimonas halophila]SDG33057.1 arabinose-5-phosphate isomerase [Limimonas halophila]
MAPNAHPDSPETRSDIAAAGRVLALERQGLEALAASLDASFAHAVDIIRAASGRVVVTGMGKSGHIARKMAATFASTGTPALYVHPGEASHGDLGMIAATDAVIALSHSGNTAELSDLIAYARRFSIPLIAVTAKTESTLATHADCVLQLPDAEEACTMGLAPTTSTTMMLALGDCLAITLLERAGFSSRDFQLLHPGGTLGSRLVQVRDIMHGPEAMPLVGPDAPMSDAILEMTARKFGCVGIVGGDRALAGIITDGDLRRHMADDLLSRRAGDVMTSAPKTVRPETLAAEALGLMNRDAITSLFVVRDDGSRPDADGGRAVEGAGGTAVDRPVGILHIHDCLRAGVA